MTEAIRPAARGVRGTLGIAGRGAGMFLVRAVDPTGASQVVAVSTSTIVGRAQQAITVNDPMVSRRHLMLQATPAGVVATDLDSVNGTFVNGARIAGPTLVQPGDAVAVGNSRLEVMGAPAELVAPAAPVAEPTPTPAPAASPVPERKLIPVVAASPAQPEPPAPAPPFANYTELARHFPRVLWHPIRVVSIASYLGLCVWLWTDPDRALFWFWKVLVPVLPLVFLLAPGIWRNVCPLAGANQTPRLLRFTRGKTAPDWLRERGYLVGVTLFLLIVATRRVALNTNGPVLSVLLGLVILSAFTGGVLFKGKSGWCSSHCPMLPVERLYGQTPFLVVPNSHCQPCVGCTKNCYDFNPKVAYQADMADPEPNWSAPRKFFASALPGVIVAFFVFDGPPDVPIATWYLQFALAAVVSAGLFFMVDGFSRISTARLAAGFGAIAFTLFYWFQGPIIAASIGSIAGVSVDWLAWPIRVLIPVLAGYWWVRTRRIERVFVVEAVAGALGKVHIPPSMARALRKASSSGGPEVQFLPDDRRVVAEPNQSLLEVAEGAGVPLEVGCRMGMCGADPIGIVEGGEHLSPVTDDEAKTLRRLGFGDSARLACCARVDGGSVCVSLDPEPDASGAGSAPDRPPDPSIRRVVIIGNGIAGVTTADFVRRGHPDCEIHVVGREPHPLYNRMGIARLVYGRSAMQGLYLLDDAWYERKAITTWLNTNVGGIDLSARTVQLGTGEVLEWDRLVLAMGSSASVPAVPGFGVPGCFVLRSAADAMAMRAHAQVAGARAAVVAGAGLLGLEAAHALAELGLSVTVLDRGPHLMIKQSDQRCSELLAAYFAGLGITVTPSTEAAAVVGDDQVRGVQLSTGATIDAELFVVCAGITPNAELALSAGVACNRGVLVDEYMRTNVAGVYAVGDVAEFAGQVLGLWPTAVGQAESAAAAILESALPFSPDPPPVILKGVGIDLVSAGRYQQRDGDEVVLIDGPGYEYRKLVVQGGVVVGGIVLGRSDDIPRLMKAVAKASWVGDRLDVLRAGDWSALDSAVPASV